MLTSIGRSQILLAWIEPPPFRDLDPISEDEPDLRLLLISDDGDVLLVELADGVPCAKGTTLWIEDRGSFEVAGVLSREGIGRSRTYMRLRASSMPAAA